MIWHVCLGYPPIETSCKKHNDPVDDEDKKNGSSWFPLFCCQKIFDQKELAIKTSMSSTDVIMVS